MPDPSVLDQPGLDDRDVNALIDRRIEEMGLASQVQDVSARLGAAGAVGRGTLLALAVQGARRKLAFGTATATYPGGTPASNVVTVNHGLADDGGRGITPIIVLLQSENGPFGGLQVGDLRTKTATQFTFVAVETAGVNVGAGSYTFDWLAIG